MWTKKQSSTFANNGNNNNICHHQYIDDDEKNSPNITGKYWNERMCCIGSEYSDLWNSIQNYSFFFLKFFNLFNKKILNKQKWKNKSETKYAKQKNDL